MVCLLFLLVIVYVPFKLCSLDSFGVIIFMTINT